GTGSLTKAGAGAVTLTGNNSYSGGTIVSAGSLIGTTSSLQGNINNYASITFDQSTSGTYSQVMSGTGSLTKAGAGTVTLTGNNSYFGGATVVDSGELNVNGSIASSEVTVNSGGSLSGSGTVGGISGAGSINPGNSPGILTAPWIDPSDGMFLNFEITGIKPEYSLASGSVNDVLHLTSASPITAAMTSANQINVYFNMASFDMTQAYLGGIYTDQQADFASMVSGANFNYYVQDNAGTVSYNGVLYSALSAGVTVSTVLDTANFADGTVNGRVMQFSIVPETSSALLVACGTLFLLRRRRKS
ncbi:MAG: autotransporter-associated beta strand repeat-containing protein, partial [Verrucomicrobia bacterium]|nr:autotransporter-associated beta strand repeat-containing protein [Verrucomicrobiota bacterium]